MNWSAIRTGDWVDRIVTPVARSSTLEKIAKVAAKLTYKVLPNGRTRDALSGTWMGHPLHPMLTDVTIGALTSAVLLDVVTKEGAPPVLLAAGVLSALPTAAAGLSDLADVERGPDRAVGAAHAIGNLTGVALFGWSWVSRLRGRKGKGVVLSLAGTAVMTGAGFLGGDLSFRRGIGVDQTVTDQRFTDWTPVIDADALPSEEPRRARAGRTDVYLYRSGDSVYALANRCSHRGGPLYKGKTTACVVRCPWHLSAFDIRDGSIVNGPATAPQPSYETRINDGKVEIRSRP